MDKKELRKIMMARRDQLSRGYVEESGRRLLANLKNSGILQGVHCIFIYVSMKNELPTLGIIDYCLKNDIQVCVPRIDNTPEGRVMRPYRIGDAKKDLVPGHFGVMEPIFAGEEAVRREVSFEEIDVVFLPGLAFDLQGNRIGYGKGYYDTYLEKCLLAGANPLKIALCYDFQIVPQLIPDEHDIPVDMLVTEKRVVRQEG